MALNEWCIDAVIISQVMFENFMDILREVQQAGRQAP